MVSILFCPDRYFASLQLAIRMASWNIVDYTQQTLWALFETNVLCVHYLRPMFYDHLKDNFNMSHF